MTQPAVSKWFRWDMKFGVGFGKGERKPKKEAAQLLMKEAQPKEAAQLLMEAAQPKEATLIKTDDVKEAQAKAPKTYVDAKGAQPKESTLTKTYDVKGAQPRESTLIKTYEEQVVQQEKTYDVKGTEVTTAYNLRLEALQVKGESLEFTGTASGIFTASANPLQRAKLRTKDLQALRSRGTLFYFDFRPTRFEVRFYDPDNMESPLGVLHADAVPPAGNPGSGAGKWSISF